MKKTIVTLVLLTVTAVFLSACGLLQEPAAPSATLEAIPLEIATLPPATDEPATAVPPTEVPATAVPPTAAPPADESYPASGAASAPADAAYPAPETAAGAAPDAAAAGYPGPETGGSGPRIYTISQEGSEVRFELDEDLRGQRITVVGVTNQVAGQLALDLNDLSTAQVGVLQINARALATDNNFRNRAIQNEILETGTYELITFTPTAVNGLPASASVGEAISFTIDGDLTIRDVTQPVTFNVTATAVSDTQISGQATATITRADFGLTIPEVPNVANVEEEVELIITFTANAAG